jgi:hypothetical protein
MKSLIERIRTCVERHAEINQLARELSELDPRELEAIVGIAPREIDDYCRTAVAETRLREEVSAAVRAAPRGSRGMLDWRGRGPADRDPCLPRSSKRTRMLGA